MRTKLIDVLGESGRLAEGSLRGPEVFFPNGTALRAEHEPPIQGH
jgi:hypothetical protein